MKTETSKMNIELTYEQAGSLVDFVDRIRDSRKLMYSRYLETITRGKEVDALIYKTLRDLTRIDDVEVVFMNIEEQIEDHEE